jgi:hypothetical protein
VLGGGLDPGAVVDPTAVDGVDVGDGGGLEDRGWEEQPAKDSANNIPASAAPVHKLRGVGLSSVAIGSILAVSWWRRSADFDDQMAGKQLKASTGARA